MMSEKLSYMDRKLTQFIDKNDYLPEIFTAWNCKDVGDIAPTLTTTCGNPTCANSLVVIEQHSKKKEREVNDRD